MINRYARSPSQRCRRFPVWLAGMMASCLAPLTGQCLTWDYRPSISFGGLYESNPSGTSESSLEDDGYATSLGGWLEISGESQTTRLSARPQFDTAAYGGTENASDLNYLNLFLPVGAQWAAQLSQYGLDGSFSRQSTRNYVSPDPNQPDTGNVTPRRVDEYQENWAVSPSASWQISPTDVVSLVVGFTDISFTDADLTGRPSSQDGFGQASWNRSFTPQQRLSLSVDVSTFESEQPRSEIRNNSVTYGINVGYQYLWSESTTVGATVGAARTDVTVKGLPFISTSSGFLPCLDPVQNAFVLCQLKTEDTNFVGQIFLSQRTGETITTEFSISRSIQPNSDGAQVTQDFARAYVTKTLSPMLSGSLGLTYSREQAVGADSFSGVIGQRFDRDYWNGQASLRWRLTRNWALRTEYAYSLDQLNGTFGNDVTRHRIDLFVQFTGLGSH